MEKKDPPRRLIRSFVRRDSRETAAQSAAWQRLWPSIGLSSEDVLNPLPIFKRVSPCLLEIGFGAGHSLLANAKAHPEWDFIGIETHRPGIGSLLQGIEKEKCTNIRIYYGDAVEIVERCLPDNFLTSIQLFFPDPWRKRRHHKRRIVQPNFVSLIAKKLQHRGSFHLATDWEDYAIHMLRVLSGISFMRNRAGIGKFANRSIHRPVITKFEKRGEKAKHRIWDLQFEKDLLDII